MFNSRRAIPWLVHSFAPLNGFNRIIKKTFLQFLQVHFFAFSSSLKTRAFILSHFCGTTHCRQHTNCLEQVFIYSGSELKKDIRKWQYNWTRCVIDLLRLVILLEFGNGSRSPIAVHVFSFPVDHRIDLPDLYQMLYR